MRSLERATPTSRAIAASSAKREAARRGDGRFGPQARTESNAPALTGETGSSAAPSRVGPSEHSEALERIAALLADWDDRLGCAEAHNHAMDHLTYGDRPHFAFIPFTESDGTAVDEEEGPVGYYAAVLLDSDARELIYVGMPIDQFKGGRVPTDLAVNPDNDLADATAAYADGPGLVLDVAALRSYDFNTAQNDLVEQIRDISAAATQAIQTERNQITQQSNEK